MTFQTGSTTQSIGNDTADLAINVGQFNPTHTLGNGRWFNAVGNRPWLMPVLWSATSSASGVSFGPGTYAKDVSSADLAVNGIIYDSVRLTGLAFYKVGLAFIEDDTHNAKWASIGTNTGYSNPASGATLNTMGYTLPPFTGMNDAGQMASSSFLTMYCRANPYGYDSWNHAGPTAHEFRYKVNLLSHFLKAMYPNMGNALDPDKFSCGPRDGYWTLELWHPASDSYTVGTANVYQQSHHLTAASVLGQSPVENMTVDNYPVATTVADFISMTTDDESDFIHWGNNLNAERIYTRLCFPGEDVYFTNYNDAYYHVHCELKYTMDPGRSIELRPLYSSGMASNSEYRYFGCRIPYWASTDPLDITQLPLVNQVITVSYTHNSVMSEGVFCNVYEPVGNNLLISIGDRTVIGGHSDTPFGAAFNEPLSISSARSGTIDITTSVQDITYRRAVTIPTSSIRIPGIQIVVDSNNSQSLKVGASAWNESPVIVSSLSPVLIGTTEVRGIAYLGVFVYDDLNNSYHLGGLQC